jgi:hypothetical protein
MNAVLDRLEGVALPLSTGEDRMNSAIGCRTSEVALHLIAQLAPLRGPTGDRSEAQVDDLLRKVTALMGELEPETAAEALLAAQMIGAQSAAMEFLKRALAAEQTVEGVDRNVNRAARLMRVFTEQLEAMAKLKGKSGQQRVVVEHVTVNGGQAVVGVLTPGEGRRDDERR